MHGIGKYWDVRVVLQVQTELIMCTFPEIGRWGNFRYRWLGYCKCKEQSRVETRILTATPAMPLTNHHSFVIVTYSEVPYVGTGVGFHHYWWVAPTTMDPDLVLVTRDVARPEQNQAQRRSTTREREKSGANLSVDEQKLRVGDRKEHMEVWWGIWSRVG